MIDAEERPVVLEPLSSVDSPSKKLRRTPTPDLLAIYDEALLDQAVQTPISLLVEEGTASQIHSSTSSMKAFREGLEESFEHVQELIQEAQQTAQEAMPELRFVLLDMPEIDFGASLEGLFVELPSQEHKLRHSSSIMTILEEQPKLLLPPPDNLTDDEDDGAMTPNTLARRMPLRCKTRVTEMATWFEKQMVDPDPEHCPMSPPTS
jgi:hypothetical protein